MSLSSTSTHLLNTGRDANSTISLGSLLQCLTILSMKKFFLISHLNFPGTTWDHYMRIHVLLLEVFVVVSSSAYCIRSSEGGLWFTKMLDSFWPCKSSDISILRYFSVHCFFVKETNTSHLSFCPTFPLDQSILQTKKHHKFYVTMLFSLYFSQSKI